MASPCYIARKASAILFLLFFISFSHAQTSVTNFEELQSALNSGETSISLDTSRIDLEDDLYSVYSRTINFTANVLPFTIDGQSSHKGFTGYSSSLNFSDTIFSNMKTASLFNTSESNFGAALSLLYSNSTISGRSSFTGNQAVTGGAVYVNNGQISFNDSISFSGNQATLRGGAMALNNYSYAYLYSGGYFQNNHAAAGGAIYLNYSYLYVNGYASFTGNSASLNGGAFTGENYSSYYFLGETYIQGNSADEKGGGFYLNNSDTEFYDTANIDSNRALLGGGFAAENNSVISFDSSTFITNNTASLNGGGFYSNNAIIVFWDNIQINNNTSSGKGGGFYSINDSLILGYGPSTVSGNTANSDGGGFYAGHGSGVSLGEALISNNTSYGSGGGFASDASEVLFDYEAAFDSNRASLNGGGFSAVNGSEVTFEQYTAFKDNSAGRHGGAFYADDATVLFLNDVDFTNNSASSGGGAIYISGNNSSASFSGNVNFTSNAASNGGAVYINSSDNFTLNGTDNKFDSNQAWNSGGALFTDSSNVSFGKGLSFTSNSAAHGGGAIYAANGSNVSLGDATAFTGNSADFGGALFIDSSDMYLLNPYFSGNTASHAGGAIYLQGSQSKHALLDIKVTSSSSVFSGNTADGVSNAIHIGDYSSANFNTAAGTSIEMHDGITSGHTDASFTYAGEGDFNFYGDASSNFADMTIAAQSGAAFNLMNGAKLNAGNFYNKQNSIFNLANSQADKVHVVNFGNDGTLIMEVFSAENDNDSITASGDVNLGTNSTLNLNDDLSDKNFRSKTFRLINYGGALNGVFDSVNFNSSVIFSTNPAINYGDLITDWITVTYRGDLNTTNFGYLSGLSFNQQQTAKTFDLLSQNSTGDLDAVISVVESGNEKDIKRALAQSSGYFLANVIRSAAIDSEKNEIYYRIKNHCTYGQLSSGLWAQFRYNSVNNFSDENSLEDYEDTSKGIMAGYDIYNNDKVLGFYGKYNAHDIKQSPENEADISNTGIGIYGGIVKYRWEIKGSLSGSYDSYSTDRYIPFLNRTARANFDGITFGADIEGALKCNITYNTALKPFIGLEFKRSKYEDFSEKKADSMNLNVEEGDYTRSAARIGVEAVYEKKFISVYANGQVKYLLSSEYPQIKASFENTNASFKSRGAEEGKTELGAAAGIALRIVENVKLFANTSYFAAEDYDNFYVNCGIRYNFCNLKLRKEPKPYTTADGFTYAPPPDFTDYAPVKTEKTDDEKTDASDKKLSDDFFNSLISAVEYEQSEDMKRALSGGNSQTINIELVQPDETGKSSGVSKTYTLSMSNFIVNKSELTEKAKNDLLFIAQEIMQTDYKNIKVEGHTDSTGNEDINTRLSAERAKAVYDVLVKAGIPSENMSYEGMSSKKPIDSNSTKKGRAKNRRVEISIE